jgi:hypothetical protein
MFPEVRKLELHIFRGTSLLAEQGFYQDGRAYIPGDALDSFAGIWEKNTVFLNSPLAGKSICLALLSSHTGTDSLPPALERFLSLCAAAGAHLTYYDGGGFPAGDLVLAIEPGGSQTGVKYLGAACSSRPLARKIAANFKQGLKLAYLPDPVAFDKPHYNLKLKLWTRLFTPAVAVQWPEGLDLGPWLFISLMEHAGGGAMDGRAFSQAQEEIISPPQEAPAVIPAEAAAEAAGPAPEAPEAAPNLPRQQSPPAPLDDSSGPETIRMQPRRSASMSRAVYPDLFPSFERKKLKKEPFT